MKLHGPAIINKPKTQSLARGFIIRFIPETVIYENQRKKERKKEGKKEGKKERNKGRNN